MTENRHFAAWARTFAGLVALAGLIGLSGCGGGSGAPNNVFNTPGALTLLPNPLTLYSGTPATVTIAGGQPPYTIVSSDSVALPVQTNVSGSTQTVFPNTVATATPVTLTALDALGAQTQSAVTIQPAPFINSLKLKADGYLASCPNPTGSANPTNEVASTFLCAGQTGSIAVQLASLVGGGIAGRLVRFDIVQGAFQIFTELPGQTPTFALTYTVPTDENGTAVARIRAVPGATQQTAIVQATDVSTGAFVRGTFVIVPVTNASTSDLVVLPNTVTFTGPDTQTCSSNVSSTFYVFGGQPPYTVVQAFPQALLLSPSVITASGGGFTVTTLGACFTNNTFIITDALGHSATATATSQFGTLAPPTVTQPNPITVTPSTVPLLTCGASTSVVATGGGTVQTVGNTQTVTPAKTFFVSTSRPSDILTALPANPAAGATITLNRMNSGTVTVGGPTTVNVSLFISDGGQTKTVSVPVTNVCP
jgi:hypothetical protein